jgi:NAD(P)-dependent dehydrogenase (short-subunit alcohol dehydrogenase family)
VIFASDLLAGQTAIVTGGGTGIGRGIALELARAGATVVVAGRRPEPLQEAAAEICLQGGAALAVPTDVRDWDQVQQLVRSAVARFGRLDILINNAGGQFGAAFEDLSPNGWKAVIDVNLNGVFNCSRAAGDVMLEQKKGKIVNVIAGFSRRAAPHISHSGAARAGVESLTRSLALEWADRNVQVNCISPVAMTEALAKNLGSGPEGTERLRSSIPAKRFASLEEVGWLVVYLVSRAGDFITGEHIVMDGGYWLATPVGLSHLAESR